jgi:hypothetical protein
MKGFHNFHAPSSGRMQSGAAATRRPGTQLRFSMGSGVVPNGVEGWHGRFRRRYGCVADQPRRVVWMSAGDVPPLIRESPAAAGPPRTRAPGCSGAQNRSRCPQPDSGNAPTGKALSYARRPGVAGDFLALSRLKKLGSRSLASANSSQPMHRESRPSPVSGLARLRISPRH